MMKNIRQYENSELINSKGTLSNAFYYGLIDPDRKSSGMRGARNRPNIIRIIKRIVEREEMKDGGIKKNKEN